MQFRSNQLRPGFEKMETQCCVEFYPGEMPLIIQGDVKEPYKKLAAPFSNILPDRALRMTINGL